MNLALQHNLLLYFGQVMIIMIVPIVTQYV